MFFWTTNTYNRGFVHFVLSTPLLRAAGLLLVLVVVGACNEQTPRRSGTLYYPVDSLITAQIRFLSAGEAQVQKTTALNNENNTTKLTLKDTTQWIKELGIFRELNIINKPVNRGLYDVSDGVADSRSNLTVKTYTAKDADVPVRFLRLYYHESPDKLRKLEAQFDVTNLLYKSSRTLSLEFQDVYTKTMLTSYSINGGQKIFMGDSVRYGVQATITHERL